MPSGGQRGQRDLGGGSEAAALGLQGNRLPGSLPSIHLVEGLRWHEGGGVLREIAGRGNGELRLRVVGSKNGHGGDGGAILDTRHGRSLGKPRATSPGEEYCWRRYTQICELFRCRRHPNRRSSFRLQG